MFAKISTVLMGSMLALCSVAQAEISISSKPTANMSCGNGVCTATAQKAVLNVGDLQTMLANGDAAVNTGSLAKDIDIDQPLTWSSTSRLTLDAQQSVTVKKQVTISGTGNLTVVTNDGGKKGEFIIVPERGSVQFWDLASSLMIDGNAYTLVEDIKTLAADIAANPSGFYALAKSYDASIDGAYSSSPIATTFTGKFEGLGNSFSNLTIKIPGSGQTIGLFAILQVGGNVRNLGIAQVDIEGNPGTAVGAIAAGNSGTIQSSWVSGSIRFFSAESNSGGLVGANFGTITSSHANIKFRVTGSGESRIGQLVGENDGTISRSYAGGSIAVKMSTLTEIGGLVGINVGTIQDCYTMAAVTRGRNANVDIGGLVGNNGSGGKVETSYAVGQIKYLGLNVELGGLVGTDDAVPGSLANTYWDLDKGISSPSQGAGNIPNDPGITGLMDAQLQSGLPLGFDPKVWGSNPRINNGYPYLLENAPH